jgi:hypothetical protein
MAKSMEDREFLQKIQLSQIIILSTSIFCIGLLKLIIVLAGLNLGRREMAYRLRLIENQLKWNMEKLCAGLRTK